jgi:hypothetical protein
MSSRPRATSVAHLVTAVLLGSALVRCGNAPAGPNNPDAADGHGSDASPPQDVAFGDNGPAPNDVVVITDAGTDAPLGQDTGGGPADATSPDASTPGAFPDPSTTGWQHTGVTLAPYTGPYTITTAGTTIDGKDLSNCVDIRADSVTIRRSRIRCPGGPEATTTFGVNVGAVHGTVLEDVENMSTTVPSDCRLGDPPLLTRPANLAQGDATRLTRVYAHNVRTGITLGSNITIEDSALYTDCNPDPHLGSGADWQHSTSINTLGGSQHIVLRHNNFDNGAENASSSASFYPQFGPNRDFTIDGNLFNVRAAYYGMYLGYTPTDGEEPNVQFVLTNNVFGTR